MATEKDTIYIDIDDEITGIIDKLKGSSGKVVALVLPKRATVFQSIVNMKLLKRAAAAEGKNAVLITSEAGLMPLAGAAGLHVAKTLNSKPEVPLGPDLDDGSEEAIDENANDLTDEDQHLPVGALAGAAAAGAVAAKAGADDVETLTLDDDEAPENIEAAAAVGAASTTAKAAKTAKKDKKLAVPNFERFRVVLILAVLAIIILVAGGFYSISVLPKAVIKIKTNAANVNVNMDLNLSTSAAALNPATNTLPSKAATQQKTYTGTATATGQKNNGNKASGTVKMTAQVCGSFDPAAPFPAGGGITSNGQTYITQSTTTFSSTGTTNSNTKCTQYDATSSTAIIAQSGGTSSNGATSFTGHNVTATGAPTSGGTDNIVTVVNQTDINNAKAKIATNDASEKQALTTQLKGDGWYPIDATYVVGTPTVTTSANAGDAVSTVTATQTTSYSMFGVHEKDLNTLLTANINKQIDKSTQSILNTGLSTANYNVTSQTATAAQLAMATTAAVGPDLNVDKIAQDAAGKKPAEVRASLQRNPDVTDVDVQLSPFFVSSVPNKTKRIQVQIAKPTTTKSSSSNGSNP